MKVERSKIIIGEQNDRVQVLLHQSGQALPEPAGDSIPFEEIFKSSELEDLRWYLEDYLPAPYAVWEENGVRIAGELKGLGKRLFQWIFGSGKPRDAYIQACQNGPFELWISSASPGFLGLPWELLYERDKDIYIALNVAAFNRSIPIQQTKSTQIRRAERLRVLMVIARPEGVKDVPYQMIARRLLPLLEMMSGHVELEVLRPPTIEALRKKFQNSKSYDVLHFDGHGTFGRDVSQAVPIDPLHYKTMEGFLVFEKETGGSDPISAEKFADLLKSADIPLLVLNSCQSGKIAKGVGPEATVATRLLQQGTAAVVAMGYKVYAEAAAEFMAVFYDTLFSGATVSEAVVKGRGQLHRRNLRPSPKGLMPLEDWIVPVHYVRREVSFPHLKPTVKQSSEHLTETLARMRTEAIWFSEAEKEVPTEVLLRPEGAFFGRDAEFYELERVLYRGGVVLVHGVGGTGKTELVKAFARWLAVSGGLSDPHLVLFQSFEPGLPSFSLDGILTEFGLKVFGPEFIRLFPDFDARRKAVFVLLCKHQILLIWDNFETVCSMPDPSGATPPLEGEKRTQVKAFLADIAKSARGSILLTSRSSENWLGKDIYRLKLSGLSPQDASEYADYILAKYPKAQKHRQLRAYGDLVDMLGGHPLSLRIMLPFLNEMEPQPLIDGLKGQGELPPGFEQGEGRLESLGACIYYSFRHIPEEHRMRLAALSLFERVADLNVLTLISEQDTVPKRFAGIDLKAWEESLNICSEVGLATKSGPFYHLHPAVPGYLMALWKTQAKGGFNAEYDAALVASIKAHAIWGTSLLKQILSGSAEAAMAVIEVERNTVGRVASEALRRQLFEEAQAIFQPLDRFWNTRGLYEEARGWVDRCQEALEDAAGTPPPVDTKKWALWLFMVNSQAIRAQRSGDLVAAETIYGSIQKMLEQSKSASAERHLASVYQNLGVVALERGEYDKAEEWCQKSLEINEELGNRPSMAEAWHNLGMIALERGEYDKAEEWCQKSLEINEELGNRPGMTAVYHELGIVAQHRGKLEKAKDWYQKSLKIKQELGDRPGMALTYNQLGTAAKDRGELNEAKIWYQKSLEINEELGNRPGMALVYHVLGMVAKDRGELEKAEDWYQKSLEIKQEFGDRPSMALTYHELGIVALDREEYEKAEEWCQKSLEITEDLGNRPGMALTYHNLGIVAQRRGKLEKAEDWYQKSLEIKQGLGDRPGMASTYHQLGRIALERGEYEKAEEWCQKSLEIKQELGNRPGMALTFALLGYLAVQQGNINEALDWTIRCVSLFSEFPHPATGLGPTLLKRLSNKLGIKAVEDSWQRVTGNPLPDHVRDALL